MRATRLGKVGNSTGLTVPREVLEEANMSRGDEVTLTVRDGRIEIAKADDGYNKAMEGRPCLCRPLSPDHGSAGEVRAPVFPPVEATIDLHAALLAEHGVRGARGIGAPSRLHVREQLAKAGAIRDLFAEFDGELKGEGHLAMSDQIVDASIIPAPRQRNTDEEKVALKEGRIPEGLAGHVAELDRGAAG